MSRLHYGFADSSNFIGVKGYEAYAAREAAATAVLAAAAGKEPSKAKNAWISSVESDDRNAGRGHQTDYGRPEGVLLLGDHDRPAIWHHAV